MTVIDAAEDETVDTQIRVGELRMHNARVQVFVVTVASWMTACGASSTVPLTLALLGAISSAIDTRRRVIRIVRVNWRTKSEGVLPEALTHQVTSLLRAWSGGDLDAQRKLLEVVHAELHRLARKYMAREHPGHTLQPTALVNEAYLRLVDVHQIQWQDRGHFFAVAARVMRRILVDSARARLYQKRGGGAPVVSLDEALFLTSQADPDLVALDDALTELAKVDERKSNVIELRFFAGLNVNETASALGISADTVTRDWKMAKVWLLREIKRKTG